MDTWYTSLCLSVSISLCCCIQWGSLRDAVWTWCRRHVCGYHYPRISHKGTLHIRITVASTSA